MTRTFINTLVILGLSLTVSQTAWAQDTTAELSFQNSEVVLQMLPMGDGTCSLEVEAVTFVSSVPGVQLESIVVTGGDQTVALDLLYPTEECEEVDGTLTCGPAWELSGQSGFFASVSAPTGTTTYGVQEFTTAPRAKGRMLQQEQEQEVTLDCPCWYRWDLDGDGQVGSGDLLLLLAVYGQSVVGTPNAGLDVNGDGMIGSMELIDFLTQYGNSCPVDPCAPGAPWSATQSLCSADYQFIGENAFDYAGYSITSAGDVDGDGLDDLLIGTKWNDEGGENAGKTYLVLGSSLGSTGTIDLSAADYTFVGENAFDHSSSSLASAGDVDGDGLDDLLIGAPFYDDEGWDTGKVYLVFGSSLGSSSTIDLSAADYTFVGENGWNHAGHSVASAGDMDGDGLDDLLISGSGNDEVNQDGGKAYLVLASSLGSNSTIDLSAADYTFVGENAYDHAGQSVASAGDVDGDGLGDLLFAAPYNDDGGGDPSVNYQGAGKVYLVLGSSLGSSSTIDLSAADYAFIGEEINDQAGDSIASAGDVDGDGLDDLLIGAYGAASAGKAYLVLGSSLGSSSTIDLSAADYAFVGETNSGHTGHSVASAGDVDGDGLDDLLISGHLNDDGAVNAGKAYLVLGSSLGSSSTIDLSAADHAFVGESAGDYAGQGIASAGDVNGDGLDDLLIGSTHNDDGGENAGKTYLFLSP